jgi:putative ABC transport system permease protein
MLGNYLKMAWKVLQRRRFFTFVSLFGISFTLTVLMLVVSILDHQLAPSYPELQINDMLVLERMRMFGERSAWHSGPGYKFIQTYTRDIPGVSQMSVFTRVDESTTFLDGRKIVSRVRHADADYWRVFQFEFLEGAPFTANDDASGNHVAVISDATRQRFFGGEEGLDKTLELDGVEYRVLGVVRDVPWYRQLSNAGVWLPIGAHRTVGFHDYLMGGCVSAYVLEPDADKRQVQAAFRERLTRVEFDDPERFQTMAGYPMTQLESLSNGVLNLDPGETAPRRLVLMALGAMLIFMVLPAINLVNINLSRIFERSGEIGVRKAFGAASPDLVLQFVVENVVLCLIGGILGLVGALLILQIATIFPQVPFMTIHLNWRIFLSALFLATLFGVISGVWPAWKMSRQHPVAALRGGAS